jgi:hypothetical protein
MWPMFWASPTTPLRCKLENESEFKVSEAEKLSKMLGMTVEQRDRCFFGPAG